MFFRSSSKNRPEEKEQQVHHQASVPRNPLARAKIDSMIDLEKKVTINKCTEEMIIQLMSYYTVRFSDAGTC